MKADEQMNWSKRMTQHYGIFMAFLGFVIGVMLMINEILLLY